MGLEIKSSTDPSSSPAEALLPPVFLDWFAARGWAPRPHQLALLDLAQKGKAALVIAPTGGGKTLAGFLPSLVELAQGRASLGKGGGASFEGPAGHLRVTPGSGRAKSAAAGGQPEEGRAKPAAAGGQPEEGRAKERTLHTLYVSPLKALAVDIARNLATPVEEMSLDIAIETRTGDTPVARRQRQKTRPPDLLLTTPEQIALLIASPEAPQLFGSLRSIIVDELHAFAGTKRGDLLALGIARLRALAPGVRVTGLSATVKDPDFLRRWLVPQTAKRAKKAALVQGPEGRRPRVDVLFSQEVMPWAGHTGRHAMKEVYDAIKGAGLTLIFVNTRFQAEMTLQELWHINDANLPIALHHGSLDVSRRRKVESAMADGKLRAVVCTSTLDLGIDWGDVDLVIQMGAPKGASRLLQRIGRANHRMDEPSRALLVPSNRFEVMECAAAREAAEAGVRDGEEPQPGAWDVLAQHIWGTAVAGPFDMDALYTEVTSCEAYSALTYEEFEQVVDFVATGGYALRRYDRYKRLVRQPDGRFRLAHPRLAQQYRMNVGTIVESPMLTVRLVRKLQDRRAGGVRGGRVLGQIEEILVESFKPGDAFVFAGEVVRFEALRETDVVVTKAQADDPVIPSYAGGKFPLSTYLAKRVREMLADRKEWEALPAQVGEWLEIQGRKSLIPKPSQMLVESFPRAKKYYLVCYPFEGRLAHQTLGMLLTRRLERAGLGPLGFVGGEYALAVWTLKDMSHLNMDDLFAEDMLGEDLDEWMAESALLKRTFRTCAVIGGLIERRRPGEEKTGRQVTFSSDLIYDVLRRHEPDHVLMKATWQDAARGLLDIHRLGVLLKRIKGRIVHEPLTRVSPLAVPVMLEISKIPVGGTASDVLLAEAAEDLIADAMR